MMGKHNRERQGRQAICDVFVQRGWPPGPDPAMGMATANLVTAEIEHLQPLVELIDAMPHNAVDLRFSLHRKLNNTLKLQFI